MSTPPEPKNAALMSLVRKAQSGMAVGQDEMFRAVLWMDHFERLPHALRYYRCFAPDVARVLLAHSYDSAEIASPLGVGRLIAAFRRVGFVTDTEGLEPPSSPLLVFRGTGASRRWFALGWTTDEERAEWFARRFLSRQPGTVFTAMVPPEGVLGMLNARKESTVIVDPRRLRERRILRVVDRRQSSNSS